MNPENSVISAGTTVQLLGLAILAIVVLALGIKIATGGAKGIAFALSEVAGLIAALWCVARPNDALGLLLHFVGGVQTLSMPH